MPRRQREGTRRGHRGASLVEFALIVPLLSMFLFGIVQFGIAYDKQQSINSAAREGARLGALESSSVADIEARAVDTYGGAGGGDDPTVEVYGGVDNTPNPPTLTQLTSGSGPCGVSTTDYDFVRVVATTSHELTIPFFGSPDLNIDSTGEFRCE